MGDAANMLRPLDWPPIRVDVDVSSEKLASMLERVEQTFSYLGNSDPHWSVLTAEKYRKEQIGENLEEFFRTGKAPVDEMMAAIKRVGYTIPSDARCLELGCGVGRSSVWLATLVKELVAVDISAPHLDLAREAATRFSRKNIQFARLDSIRRLSQLGQFDLFFSIIVLQHNAPPVIVEILKQIFSSIRPNGLVYFQVPTYRLGYTFNADAYLARKPAVGQMEMHVVLQPVLHRLLSDHRFQLLEVREDAAASKDHVSTRFLAKKG